MSSLVKLAMPIALLFASCSTELPIAVRLECESDTDCRNGKVCSENNKCVEPDVMGEGELIVDEGEAAEGEIEGEPAEGEPAPAEGEAEPAEGEPEPVRVIAADCQAATFQDADYLVCTSPRTFAAARTTCADAGALLAVWNDNGNNATDELEEQTLAAAANTLGVTTQAWIGLSDTAQESRFVWENGTALNLASANDNRFGANEPNDGAEDCIEALENGGLWNDQRCTNTRPFVCEGIGAGATLAGTCTRTTILGVANYALCTGKQNYVTARATCTNMAGTLVSFAEGSDQKGEDERVAVHNAVIAAANFPDSDGQIRYWIGLNDIVQDDAFIFDRGNAPLVAARAKFNTGEPSAEDCVVENIQALTWDDRSCNATRAAICELQ